MTDYLLPIIYLVHFHGSKKTIKFIIVKILIITKWHLINLIF